MRLGRATPNRSAAGHGHSANPLAPVPSGWEGRPTRCHGGPAGARRAAASTIDLGAPVTTRDGPSSPDPVQTIGDVQTGVAGWTSWPPEVDSAEARDEKAGVGAIGSRATDGDPSRPRVRPASGSPSGRLEKSLGAARSAAAPRSLSSGHAGAPGGSPMRLHLRRTTAQRIGSRAAARRFGLAALLVLLAVGAAAPAHAGTLPTGFQDAAVFSSLDRPTAVRFASDGRVFVAQKNGIVKVFSSADGDDPHDLRRPAVGGRRLLGPRTSRARARSPVPDPAVRVRPLRVRRAAGRDGARLERRVFGSDRQRVRHLRAALAPDRQRERLRRRAAAHQRLVPAVSEPFHRLAGLRRGRLPLRQRRRRRQLQLRRLGSARRQPEPHAHRTGQRLRRP